MTSTKRSIFAAFLIFFSVFSKADSQNPSYYDSIPIESPSHNTLEMPQNSFNNNANNKNDMNNFLNKRVLDSTTEDSKPQNTVVPLPNIGPNKEEFSFVLVQSGTGKPTPYSICDSNNRPKTCLGVPTPVCGFLTGCPKGICAQTYPSPCSSCSDPKVGVFISGACEKLMTSCDTIKLATPCPTVSTPVCASQANCMGLDCIKTFDNFCLACTSGYSNYTMGECPVFSPDQISEIQAGTTGETDARSLMDLETIDEFPAYCDIMTYDEDCPDENKPVCAYMKNCAEEVCSSTIVNSCQACKDPAVEYYMPGAC